MITVTQGNILKADVEALVNTVNCVGVMGRGIALQFKKAYPENFKLYKKLCENKELQPGKLYTYPLNNIMPPQYIINFPTKEHWRGNSKLAYIDSGLKTLIREVQRLGIKSIAIPPLGCGLGGLDWSVVRPLIEKAMSTFTDVKVVLYEPAGSPAARAMVNTSKTPNMTVGRAGLLKLMDRYLAGFMDPFISLLEIHKLMYFMQEAGEPLKLRYKKAPYGPYAENLRHVLTCIEGHFISGYGDAEDKPDKEIELERQVLPKAEELLLKHRESHKRLEQVMNLIEGFESPFGMELLSTVHWVSGHEGASNESEAIQLVYKWNQRKRMFTEQQITIAWKILGDKGWFSSLDKGSAHGGH